jgi:N-acetylglucosaminyldiphosphoundecaprenol N-acetyl-beta-D-mannosaminyltransferase
MHNHRRLSAPVRGQFGATINFEAGTVKRAPHFMRSTGFEWLWRIKEEPYLWRRYWSDGKALFQLLIKCVLPLVIEDRLRRREPDGLSIKVGESANVCTVELVGDAVADNIDQAIHHFRNALKVGKQVLVDISGVRSIDSRFFGLLLMVRKNLANQGTYLRFRGASPKLRRVFRLNRFEFLLSQECDTDTSLGTSGLSPAALRVQK